MDQEPYNASEEELREIIKEALKTGLEEKKHKIKKSRLQSALTGTLGEFLDSYILLGYDLDGENLIIRNGKTSQQNEALNSLLIKYVAYIMQGYEDV